MIKEQYKYSDLTGQVIKCAMKVHSTLKNGFRELIYQRALANEMKLAQIDFEREFEMPIFYNHELIGNRRVDFLIEKKISEKLKRLRSLKMYTWRKR